MDNPDIRDWTVCSVLDWTADYFERHNISGARLDAEILLSHVLKCPRLDLNLRKDERIPEKILSQYKRFITERKERKPLAYILGEHEFMGMSFRVNNATLIPRPETELLVEEVVNLVRGKGKKVLVEVGTGSGNISVSIAKLTDITTIYATDISMDALKVAQENVFKHSVASKVVLRQGDMFRALESDGLEGKTDIIVSNPPYVSLDEFDGLEPELKYEPRNALNGGEDGLDFYKILSVESRKYLKPGGLIAVELNSNKSYQIRDIFESTGFAVETIIKDYSGLDRVLTAKIINSR
ncbi:MAG: peptide chain release factor N(5)-glutamine methyltransferase [Elusimicrobiota bacterium]